MSVTSSYSDAVICVDEVLDAANTLPEPARRSLATALRERSPVYCWTMERTGRLTCRHIAAEPRFDRRPWWSR